VTDLDKAGNGLTADALRGAVGCDQLGMVGFELRELRNKSIVFEIGDGGRCIDVIAAIVLANFVAEALDFVFDGIGHGHILQPIEQADDAAGAERFGIFALLHLYFMQSRRFGPAGN
jgi:hypothetical protein